MARKIRITGVCIILLVIIAALTAMSVVQARTVGNVEKAAVTSVQDSSAVFSWKRVSAADGYYIYQRLQGEEKYTKAAEITDGKAQEYTLKKLEQATAYDFYITAFKRSKHGVESKAFETLSVCTLPAKQQFIRAVSPDAGELSLAWEMNNGAAGYELQCAMGDAASLDAAPVTDIPDATAFTLELPELQQLATYSVRVRSYTNYQNEKLYGAWSDVQSVVISEKVEMPDSIDTTKPMIALTFDDGPGYNKASEKILDVLEKYNAKATFFMVGKNVKDHPKNVQRKLALGCELGNHTWNHSHYGKKVTASDIKKCSDAINAAAGQYPTAFRSPGGNTTSEIREECKKENMVLYYWSLDTQDWKSRDADKVYKKVMNNVKDGDIILMHEIYDSTAEAVERMVPELLKQGYQLVTCEQLVTAKSGKKPQAGQQYMNATTVKNKTS